MTMDAHTTQPLEALLQRQGSKNDFWLLHEIHGLLQAHLTQADALPVAWQSWWDLIRFCLGTHSITHWLCNEPESLQRIQALAALSHEDALADILSEALQGQAQQATTVTFSQLGAEDICLPLADPSEHHYLGQDWSSTDAAIQLLSDGFTHTVAALIVAEREKLFLPAPTLPAQPPQTATATTIPLEQAVPHILTQTHLTVRNTAQAGALSLLPVRHHPGPVMDADLLEFYKALWPQAPLQALLQAYSAFDGAHLFNHAETVGLTLFPIEQWEERQQHMLEQARTQTWRDAPDELPYWLTNAICFGQNGMESEYWVLVTEGNLSGSVLLSETDALAEQARFAHVADFFTALCTAPQRVLNAGGNLRYVLEQQRFEPIGLATPSP